MLICFTNGGSGVCVCVCVYVLLCVYTAEPSTESALSKVLFKKCLQDELCETHQCLLMPVFREHSSSAWVVWKLSVSTVSAFHHLWG